MIDVTDATFENEVLKTHGLVMVDFWAEWCGPCKSMIPIIEQIAEKYEGALKVVKLNVDINNLITNKYNIRGIPTILFFHDGKLLHEQVVGSVSASDLIEIVEEILQSKVYTA